MIFFFMTMLTNFYSKYNSNQSRAANCISSTKRIIKHSVVAAATTKEAITKTKNILKWFQPINRIQAMAPPAAPPFWGAYFKGTYLPSESRTLPPS